MGITSFNYIKQHWNGDLKHWQTFWLNTVSLFLLLQVSLLLIHAVIHEENSSRDITLYTISIAFWSLGVIPALIWQIKGNFQIKHQARTVFPIIYRLTTQAITLILGTICISQVILHLPGTVHAMQIMLKKDPISRNAARISTTPNTIEISGSIDFSLPEKLSATIKKHPQARVIRLNSTGGYLPPARKAAELIIKHGLHTHVLKTCHSACTLIFIAGKKRTISPAAKLGFHLPFPPYLLPTRQRKEMSIDQNFIKNQGVSGDFITKIYNTPSSTLWFPDHKELITSGYISRTTGRTAE